MFFINTIKKNKLSIDLLIKNNVIGGINCSILNKSAIINNIYINNKHRKMGYGSKLLNKTESIVKNMNIKEMNLTAWSLDYKDSLNEFYIKHNFKISDNQPNINFIDDYNNIYYLTNFTKKII